LCADFKHHRFGSTRFVIRNSGTPLLEYKSNVVIISHVSFNSRSTIVVMFTLASCVCSDMCCVCSCTSAIVVSCLREPITVKSRDALGVLAPTSTRRSVTNLIGKQEHKDNV